MSHSALFDANYRPTAQLIDFLMHVGMPASENSTLAEINEWAQKHLLRRGERWEEQDGRFEMLKEKVTPFLKEWGFLGAVHAQQKLYDGAVIYGALATTVRDRLHFLAQEWENGVRFSKVYFWTGGRPLEPKLESEEVLLSGAGSELKIRKDWVRPAVLPTTECEMAQLVWEQLELPNGMRESVEPIFVNVPMGKTRPTTDDTAVLFFKMNPIKGNYLVVSNAQYRMRQGLVANNLAPTGYYFEAIGSAAKEDARMAIIVDEVARYIFEVNRKAVKSIQK